MDTAEGCGWLQTSSRGTVLQWSFGQACPRKVVPSVEAQREKKLLLSLVLSLVLGLLLEMSLVPMGLGAKSARSDFAKNFFSRKVFEVLKMNQSVATLMHFCE